tara:strand:- start:379 stop:534 length:156 start_codon:yes stop_codon:yes gene_type:complete
MKYQINSLFEEAKEDGFKSDSLKRLFEMIEDYIEFHRRYQDAIDACNWEKI